MIFKIIFGLAFVLFVPGFLFSLLLFDELSKIQRICISIGLSIVIVVLLGFFLTGTGVLLDEKGITASNVWASLISISFLFVMALLLKRTRTKVI